MFVSCPKTYTKFSEPKFVQEENNAWFLLSQCRVWVDSCVPNRLINESVSKWILSKIIHQIFEPKFVPEENNAWFLLSQCWVSVNSCVIDWLMSLSGNVDGCNQLINKSVSKWILSKFVQHCHIGKKRVAARCFNYFWAMCFLASNLQPLVNAPHIYTDSKQYLHSSLRVSNWI